MTEPFLSAGFEAFGDSRAAVDDNGTVITYRELTERADALAASIGIERQLVLLEGNNTVDWLVAYVACLRGRHPVLIAPAGAEATFQQFTQRFEPSVRLTAATGYEPVRTGHSGVVFNPELALLLSTSGSTGSVKCVRISQTNLVSNAASIAEYLALTQEDRGTVNLPTHYSYGLSIVNSHLCVGAAVLLTGRSVVDRSFWSFLGENGATSFAGVPHVYDLLKRVDLVASAPESLRFFTQAGGRLPADNVRFFEDLAARNGWRFFVMYGQTEATARIAYMPPEDLKTNADCIGRAIPRGTLSLIDENGVAIADQYRDGELVYDGPNVMMGYATEAADLALPTGPSRLSTGDIARRTASGYFKITGRMSRFVKIFGNRLGLDDVERLLADAGHESIATGIDDQLLVVTRDAGAVEPISAFLSTHLKLPPAYFEVRVLPEYPLLVTGKIDYAGLKASLQAKTTGTAIRDGAAANHPEADSAQAVRDGFVAVFGDFARDGSASFNSLGGDSLNYILVVMEIEAALPALPEDWEKRSIDELSILASSGEAVVGPATSTNALVRELTTLDIARGFSVLLVVILHIYSGHFSLVVPYPAIDHLWDNLVSLSRPIRMPVLFLISGFLVRSAIDRPWREIFEGRVLSLIYIFSVWHAFMMIRNAVQDYHNGLNVTPVSMVQMYLEQYVYPISPLWFIYALILYFVAARVMNTWPRWIAFSVALLVSAFAESLPAPGAYVARCLVFYLLGAYLPAFIKETIAQTSWRNAAIALVAYGAATLMIIRVGATVPGIWLPAEIFGLIALLMGAGLIIDSWVGRNLASFGTKTLPIFVLHTFLIALWNALLQGPAKPLADQLFAIEGFVLVYPLVLLVLVVTTCLAIYSACLAAGLTFLFELPKSFRRNPSGKLAKI